MPDEGKLEFIARRSKRTLLKEALQTRRKCNQKKKKTGTLRKEGQQTETCVNMTAFPSLLRLPNYEAKVK